jgi:hypothetical protein
MVYLIMVSVDTAEVEAAAAAAAAQTAATDLAERPGQAAHMVAAVEEERILLPLALAVAVLLELYTAMLLLEHSQVQIQLI